MSKSEAIHIGSLKGSDSCPFEDVGLKWKSNSFKALGINFSLNINYLYELNFISKLAKIEQTLNCWRHRNLSLLGKVAVIKSLLLLQLLYLFSVLCIHIPKSFFKKLITSFINSFGMVEMDDRPSHFFPGSKVYLDRAAA